MIGIHDIGGYHYPIPIDTEDDITFHTHWESLSFAMLLATSAVGSWSLDEFRHEIEKMPPADYLSTPYYVHWLESMENLCVREGWITEDELTARQADVRESKPLPEAAEPDPAYVERQSKGARDIAYVGLGARQPDLPQSFSVGEKVRARSRPVPGHTRLQHYVWGKTGTIVAYSGTFPLPDTLAHRQGANPEPTYAVRFEAVDLWGESAEPNTSVTLDLWESYMDHETPTSTPA
jgi:nitrile hydratase